jgi:hypothetical protein
MEDRDVRRLVLTAGAVLLAGCGTAAQTARNPEPTASTRPRMHRQNVGDVTVLTGVDDASGTGTLRLAVKVKDVVSTAMGRGAFEKPRKGERFAAVRFVFKNVGATGYHDSPTFGAKLIDADRRTGLRPCRESRAGTGPERLHRLRRPPDRQDRRRPVCAERRLRA